MATFLACPGAGTRRPAPRSAKSERLPLTINVRLCTRQIRMRQRLALVAVKQHDVASLGLGLAQLKPEPNALDLVGDLPPLQRVPWPPPPEVFFRSALESCDGPISTSSRFLISAMRRGIVQFARFATGASSNGAQTRSAASVFSGGGPAYTLAAMASTPPRAKSPRQKRTVSASPRLRESAKTSSAARCSPLALTGDLPAMSRPRESVRRRNYSQDPLVKFRESARANRIKDLREKRGWTQGTLAAKIGEPNAETISKIERGVQRITESQLHTLATVFGVRIDDLYAAGSQCQAVVKEATSFSPDASSFQSQIPLQESHRSYQINKSHLDQLGYRDSDQIIVSISCDHVKDMKLTLGVVKQACPSG